jgi:hypothetical protein
MPVICPTTKAKYFCERGWTWRANQLGRGVIPEAANGSRECAPDDRLRGYPESIAPHQC